MLGLSNQFQEEKTMNTAQPIRKEEDLEDLKRYYREIQPNARNQLLVILGLNTALRISDLLSLQWKDVYLFEWEKYRDHICLVEQKTGKKSSIYVNQNIVSALQAYRLALSREKKEPSPQDYLFSHTNKNEPITRVQAFRIIKKAVSFYHIPGVICCHSLRKTFGYQAWRQGVPPALLVNIYNHSSYEVTKRYLGIEQEDRDRIFENIRI